MSEIISFGEWVQTRRSQLRYSRKAFAELMSCAPVTIKKIERDERRPSAEMAQLLATHLQIPESDQGDFIRRARGEFVARFASPGEMSLAEAQTPAAPDETPKHNLPAQTTTFVGRENELHQLSLQLSDPACRLLTILGPGGMGKTRLSIEAARAEIENFTDGVTYIELAPIRATNDKDSAGAIDPIANVLAKTLGMSFQGGSPPEQQLLRYLRRKELFIVFDNFEHLLESAPFLAQILQQSPDIKILTTSRERLNLLEEWTFALHGLAFSNQTHGIDQASGAVDLFTQRARQVNPNFNLAQDESAVMQICRLVEGMPLGLELAASWVNQLSCQDIADEIESELDFLAAEIRNVPDRHRSIRAVFAHSWEKLSTAEQDIVQKLSVFRGGFERKAAKAVAGASLSILSKLVDKSILSASNGRYQIHELLRQFGAEKLAISPEKEADTRLDHAQFYVQLVTDQEKKIKGTGLLEMKATLNVEFDNVYSAIHWTIDLQPQLFNRSFWQVLWMFYHLNEWFSEGTALFDRISQKLKPTCVPSSNIQSLDQIPPQLICWIEVNIYLSGLQTFITRTQQALETLEQFSWLESTDDPRLNWTKGLYLQNLGWVKSCVGQIDPALADFNASLKLLKEVGDVWLCGWNLLVQGQLYASTGDHKQTILALEEGIRLLKPTGEQYVMSYLMHERIRPLIFLGEYEQAKRITEKSIQHLSMVESQRGICYSLLNLANIATFQGDFKKAKDYCNQSLHYAQESEDQLLINDTFWVFGNLAVAENDFNLAKQCFAAINYHDQWINGQIGGPGWVSIAFNEYVEARHIFSNRLQTVLGGGGKTAALDALVGIAHIKTHEGDFSRALELLALVKNHSACSDAVKQKANKLWDELGAELPFELIELTEARGRELDLFKTAEALLVESAEAAS